MGMNDAVATAQAARAQADLAADQGLYQAGYADGKADSAVVVPPGDGSAPAPTGGLTQADVDAAVAAQKAQDQAAMDQASAALASLQAQYDALLAQDNADKAALAPLQAEIDSVKAIVDGASSSAPAPAGAPTV